MKRRSIAVTALGIFCLLASVWLSTNIFATAAWTSAVAMPTARYGSSVGTINGKIYVATGCCSTFVYPYSRFTQLEAYDPQTDSWSTLASIPLGVYGAATGAIDGKLYVAGGESSPAEGQVTARLQVYDPGTDTWTDKAPLPSPQRSLAGAVLNGKLYATGIHAGALFVYDPVTDSWSSEAAPAIARWSTSLVAANGKLYLIGGHDNSAAPIAAVEEYDPVTGTWAFKASLPIPETGASVATINDVVYVIGGLVPATNTVLSAVQIYDPATDVWSSGPALNNGRVLPMAASVNNRIYTIGGFDIVGGLPSLFGSVEVLVANQAPTISGASISVIKNSSVNAQIATVDDADEGATGLTVTVTSNGSPNGVTVSNIVNSGGIVTADISSSSNVGPASFTVEVTDSFGETASAALQVNVIYDFGGFAQPVSNMPTLNVANAGSAIPVKFSLSGDQGLSIFAAGYPVSGSIACDASDPGSSIEETVTAGGTTLSYNAVADQYSYIWKTDKAWRGTCRMLVVRFIDGTEHSAKFRFR